jgi:RNA polymerase sigma-70 factor (sigma-E family)
MMSGATADDPGGRDGLAAATRPGSGDAAVAVTSLFREHHLELVRLALVMVGDLATAEDVVQDAFERLHRGWRGLRQPSSSLAYVRSSVLNGCRSVHRRAAVARKHVPELAGSADTASPDAASAADDRGEMTAALRSLPRRQREVLVLRYYLDLEVAEIAGTLRISPSAVRSTNTRGLAALARALGEDEIR